MSVGLAHDAKRLLKEKVDIKERDAFLLHAVKCPNRISDQRCREKMGISAGLFKVVNVIPGVAISADSACLVGVCMAQVRYDGGIQHRLGVG